MAGMGLRTLHLLACSLVSVSMLAAAADAETGADITIDFSTPAGKVKPLHGVNNGPVARGENADLGPYHAEAGFPHTRLHDVHWPYPDVVDVSTVFPLWDADPDDPKSYTFAKTDDYLAAIVRNRSQIIYRLGESIEPWTRYHNHPPKDFAKWAKVCVNIIRHYNDGWAGGFHHGIKYWEVWNEPEAAFMWTGKRDQYLELYEVTARAIKAHDPSLKVGGPSSNNIGSELIRPFLTRCRDKTIPLDFFSWHVYAGSTREITDAADAARRVLDEHGFTATESHLNEWRYWPTWSWLRPGDPKKYPEVKSKFAENVGTEGAAFAVSVLILLQDKPVDVANFYAADASTWGMFDAFGIPSKTYFAFRAFNELAKTPNRVSCEAKPRDGVVVCAGVSEDKKTATVLVGSFKSEDRPLGLALRNLPGAEAIRVQIYRVDEKHDLDPQGEQILKSDGASVAVELPRSGVVMLKLSW